MAKQVLYIEGRRDGYAPCQCGETLTVGALRDWLSDFSDDALVYLKNDNGYTYGSIDEGSFEEDILED